MSEKPGSSASDTVAAPSVTGKLDVWGQLAEFTLRADIDPVLRLLIDEARQSHHELRGVTVAIANRYRALIDAVPDAITIHDEAGRTLDVNESACRLLGLDRDVLLGRLIVELFPGLDKGFAKGLQDASDRDATFTCSSTLPRLDARDSTLELNGRVYLDGQQKRTIVATRDLGPREQAHEQLRRSEAELRQLLRDMDKGVIVRNRQGHIISINPSACRMLQMSEPDLLALRSDQLGDWRFVDANGRLVDHAELPWSRAMATGKPVESTICGVISPNASTILWVSVASVPRFGDDNTNAEHVVSIFADITTIKQDASLLGYAQSLIKLGTWQLISRSERMIWSTQMHSIFDVPLSTPTTRERMLSHFNENDKQRLRQAIEAARSDETTEFLAQITTAIGRRRRVRIRVRTLDKESTSGDVIGCVQDVTGETEHHLPDIAE